MQSATTRQCQVCKFQPCNQQQQDSARCVNFSHVWILYKLTGWVTPYTDFMVSLVNISGMMWNRHRFGTHKITFKQILFVFVLCSDNFNVKSFNLLVTNLLYDHNYMYFWLIMWKQDTQLTINSSKLQSQWASSEWCCTRHREHVINSQTTQ